MKQLQRFSQWLSLFLTSISFAIALTINSTWLYRWAIDRDQLLTMTTLSKQELMAQYHQLLAYLNFPWITELNLAAFPMSESGMTHFVDVKHLFLINSIVLLVTIVPTLYFLISLAKTNRFWQVIRPMQIAMAIPFIFACLMLAGFDRFFITFHEVLFRNADWVFNPATDPIINVLPESFFLSCFACFFICLEAIFFFLYWMGKRSLK